MKSQHYLNCYIAFPNLLKYEIILFLATVLLTTSLLLLNGVLPEANQQYLLPVIQVQIPNKSVMPIESITPRNRPFLTTREFFVLKSAKNQELLQRYRQSNLEQKRTILLCMQVRSLV